MADLLEISKDETKRIIDMPDGSIEILRQKNETQLTTGFLQPIVPILGEARGRARGSKCTWRSRFRRSGHAGARVAH